LQTIGSARSNHQSLKPLSLGLKSVTEETKSDDGFYGSDYDGSDAEDADRGSASDDVGSDGSADQHISSPAFDALQEICLPDALINLSSMIAANSHQRWVHKQLRAGWSHGLVFDMKKKTDPKMVMYEQLSEHERKLNAVGADLMVRGVLQAGFVFKKKIFSTQSSAQLKRSSSFGKTQRGKTEKVKGHRKDIESIFHIYTEHKSGDRIHCADVKRALEDFGLPMKSPTEVIQIIHEMDPR
jgi:hypothetical protein